MSEQLPNRATAARRGRARAGWRSTLWGYNLRIIVGNTYWLAVTPVVATQLVIFWSMATSSLFSATRAAQTIELLAPILGAFLCAHALAPEQDGVGELVFVRPLSLEKVLLLRLAMIFAFVLALLIPLFVICAIGIDDFPLGLAILAALPSMLFLSTLALAVASTTRHPLLGLAAASFLWALDSATGGYYHPLLSLHRFADHLADRPMSEQWVTSKLLLLLMAVACYLWGRRLLGRPPAPRRWVAAVRSAVVIAVLLVAYIASGAGYKVAYGLRHERQLGQMALFWYQQQFRGYGFLPVARIFGPAFPLYLQVDQSRSAAPGRAGLGAPGGGTLLAPFDTSRMRALVARYPHSIWADNAQFEIALHGAPREKAEPWLVISYRAGEAEPRRRLVTEDLDFALRELTALVHDYPNSPFVPAALSRTAQIGLTKLDFALAQSACERLVTDHPLVPEAYDAGIRLSCLYLRQGKADLALRAADTAARVARWDVQAEAFLAAARAAQQTGDRGVARDRYQKARAAAQQAIARAIRGDKSPSHLPKQDQFTRADAVVHACDQALATLAGQADLGPPTGPEPAFATVTGRVASEGNHVSQLRVALGVNPDLEGFPSPFLEGPAVSAAAGPDGTFQMKSVLSGAYPVFAVAFRTWGDESSWAVTPLPLPVAVGGAPVALPPVTLSRAAPPIAQPDASRAPARVGRGGLTRRGRGGGDGTNPAGQQPAPHGARRGGRGRGR